MNVPVYVIVRDRVTDLKLLVEWLERAGHDRIVLLDNDSEWPPALEYLEATPHQVVRLRENLGPQCLWHLGAPDEWFVYTDPDIVPLDDCPPDAVDHLRSLLDRYDYSKAGLGLFVDDLPKIPELNWERSLHGADRWQGDCYKAPVDTTFALYRPGVPWCIDAVRSGPPYEVRHMPWYRTRELSAEDRFYYSRASGASTWGQQMRLLCGH